MPEVPAPARKPARSRLLAGGRVVTPAGVLRPGWIRLAGNVIEMAAAGRPDGSYRLGSMRVNVTGGVARLVDGTGPLGPIAGSTATMDGIVRRAVADDDFRLSAVMAGGQWLAQAPPTRYGQLGLRTDPVRFPVDELTSHTTVRSPACQAA